MATPKFRPMLASECPLEYLPSLRYPITIQPKIDGIRVVCHPQLGPITRSAKPVPNLALRQALSAEIFKYLDGEVTYGSPTDPDVFNKTTGLVRQIGGPSEGFTFTAFDNILHPGESYGVRYVRIPLPIGRAAEQPVALQIIEQGICRDAKEVEDGYNTLLSLGYEGAMLRDPNGPYKNNRSTLKEGYLLKLKPMATDDAEIIGFDEKMHNANPAELNERGYTERSSAKGGLVPANTLGALRCRCLTGQFKHKLFQIGSGFDDNLRSQIWANRDKFLFQTVTFTHQLIGAKDVPRFPVFKGFRAKEDQS